VEWGNEVALAERLGPYVQDMRVERRAVYLRALSPEQWVEFMRTYFGPAIEAFQYSNSPVSHKALAEEMAALIREHNCAQNGTVMGNSEYLEIVATRHR
jgi:hypothetical protein